MASSIPSSNWLKWLQDHPSNTIYDSSPEEIAKLCTGADPKKNFENISKCKNLPLLTRALIGMKMQITFFHSVVGIPIRPDDLQFVARLATKEGTGVEVDPKTIFRMSTAIYVPSLLSMMKVETKEDFESVEADQTRAKKKVRDYGLLTPALGKAVARSDKTPAGVFTEIVKEIKNGMTAANQPDETEEEMLQRAGSPYESILRFIWALKNHEGILQAPGMAPLSDEQTIAWEKESREQTLKTRETAPAMLAALLVSIAVASVTPAATLSCTMSKLAVICV